MIFWVDLNGQNGPPSQKLHPNYDVITRTYHLKCHSNLHYSKSTEHFASVHIWYVYLYAT